VCGIAGIVSTVIAPAEAKAMVERMLSAQHHRGPDDAGAVVFPEATGTVALGNRRLAIIDLSPAGHMPMTNEDQNVWVTFNGEIYNFAGLRDQLITAGHVFKSRSDSEVIVHGYEQWGIAGLLQRLNGMYAIAIWDRRRKRLSIARDRFGEKPLYYFWDGKTFVFASELKSLLASSLIERRVNPAGIHAYLSLGSVPAPLTIIKGAAALLRATYLTFELGSTLHETRYWRLNFSEAKTTLQEAVEQTATLLREAVECRLISDVPLGVFLSGGIDSSAIVALMREGTQGTIRTSSVVFREKEFSEGSIARQTSAWFQTEHTEFEVTAEDALAELPRIMWAMDQPTIDGVNTYFVSKITRNNGTVVALSGLGGDELFGGYPSFRTIPKLCSLSRGIHFIPGLARLAAYAVAAPVNHRYQKLASFLDRTPDPEAAYLAVRGLYTPEEIKSLAGDVSSAGAAGFDPIGYLRTITEASWPASFNTISTLELGSYMQSQLLRDTDAMSMAHSLEVRVPFLDHRLAEYLATVPARYKSDKRPKSLLLKALAGKLPPDVQSGSKRGFTFPFDRWLAGPWRKEIESVLLSDDRSTLLRLDSVNNVWRNFLQGRSRWSRPWALYVLKRWISAYLN
jgi:asparagine synthase (glutamine-hydrolysing)